MQGVPRGGILSAQGTYSSGQKKLPTFPVYYGVIEAYYGVIEITFVITFDLGIYAILNPKGFRL